MSAEGNVVALVDDTAPGTCGVESLRRLQLMRWDGTSDDVLGYVDHRCVDEATTCMDVIYLHAMAFDAAQGRLLVRFQSVSIALQGSCANPYERLWIATFDGFATTFDVLQSFEPDTTTLGFRVPYMPQGMNGTDWFDTYYGDLATVGDWSQAQPLQCAYPATPPETGDYLTVEDTLPTPQPGQGYYYVTAATYQGETRYGRKAEGGVLSGRDPAVLPACAR